MLIEFWTFGCYNCRNTLPFVKSWHYRYSETGLTLIGVGSPEFDEERDGEIFGALRIRLKQIYFRRLK